MTEREILKECNREHMAKAFQLSWDAISARCTEEQTERAMRDHLVNILKPIAEQETSPYYAEAVIPVWRELLEEWLQARRKDR